VGTALFIAYAVLAFNAKVIEALADVMVMKGVPEHLRSDNGPEFVARDLRKWLEKTERRSCTSSPDLRERTNTVRVSTLAWQSSPRFPAELPYTEGTGFECDNMSDSMFFLGRVNRL
jgi:hypothetical protein